MNCWKKLSIQIIFLTFLIVFRTYKLYGINIINNLGFLLVPKYFISPVVTGIHLQKWCQLLWIRISGVSISEMGYQLWIHWKQRLSFLILSVWNFACNLRGMLVPHNRCVSRLPCSAVLSPSLKGGQLTNKPIWVPTFVCLICSAVTSLS